MGRFGRRESLAADRGKLNLNGHLESEIPPCSGCSVFLNDASNVFQSLVAKPDQLIKRRGKLGLIKVKTDFAGASSWIQERLGKDQKVRWMLILYFFFIPHFYFVFISCFSDVFIQNTFVLCTQIGKATGKLKNFIIEPFVPHKQVIYFSQCLISGFLRQKWRRRYHCVSLATVCVADGVSIYRLK